MFCPQCGNESAAGQHYCRSCGTNLNVIGKAVTLSEAMSNVDGVPAKIKEIIGNVKIAHVTEEVTKAMDKMNQEIVRSASQTGTRLRRRRQKSAAERRERHLARGIVKLFWGSGLTVFLYFLANALVLKLPPDVIAKIPFEVNPVVHVIWLIGLLPILSGMGHILAALTIRRDAPLPLEGPAETPLRIDSPVAIPPPVAIPQYDPDATRVQARSTPASVTDRTTNILDRDPSRQASGGY